MSDNKIVLIVAVVALLIVFFLFSRDKKPKRKERKDGKDISKNIKESFIDEMSRTDSTENTEDIIENYPQTTAMNVLYSDPSGNLGSTTDLGLQNLTVNGDSMFANKSVALSSGDLGGPSAHTRINSQGIIFGGDNNGKQWDSAQISAGRHEAGSLCIVGMSKDTDWANRKITMWSEGGTKHYGPMTVSGQTTTGRLVIGGDLNGSRAMSVQNGVKDWTAQIGNGTSGANVYMAHGDKYGMHINANNKDMDTYAFQCYGGDKHLMTLDGKANLNVSGNVGANTMSFPNGWSINTTDGHFRIKKDGVDKLVAHADGYPAWAPNGLNAGEWTGEGGGAVTTSKMIIKQTGTDNKFVLVPETPNDGHQYGGQRLSLINKNGAPNVRFYQGGWGNLADEGTESIDFFKRQDGNSDNRAYLRMIDGMWSARGDCGTGWPHAGCNIGRGQFG